MSQNASKNSNLPLTAQQVIELIQQNIEIHWREETVDTFKTGDPDATVTGIVVTMVPTLDVLQEAVACGANLIIAHEPAFYGHFDGTAQLEAENDAVFIAKRNFIEENGLILWRFHDHWHWCQPDGILRGMVETLGWQEFQNPDNAKLFVLPPTTLEALASQLKKSLGIRALRIVGDDQLNITKAAFSAGFPGFDTQRGLLQSDEVEVLIMGEDHEWETIAYAYDAVTAKQRKALIILGHVPSEQGGMESCAHWLQSFLPPLPIHFVPTPEPFWVLPTP